MENNENSAKLLNKEKDLLFWRIWNNLEISICSISLAMVTIITFCNVFARYLIRFSFPWSEEVCRFLLVWMTFGGAAYAFRLGVNIGVTFFVDILPERISSWLKIITSVVTIVFFAILLYYGYNRVAEQFVKNQVSPAARIPMMIPFSAIPIGSAMVIVRLVQQLISDIQTKMAKGSASS